MLKIGRVYFDACGYHDGVLEEIILNAIDEAGNALPHVLHAPNGVGKTTILSLLFSVFEPNRRKFLRTEINSQHCFEHYFLPGRLGVVAIELIREVPKGAAVRYVIGQCFWMTSASKGEDGESGQRRLFAFECQGEAHLRLVAVSQALPRARPEEHGGRLAVDLADAIGTAGRVLLAQDARRVGKVSDGRNRCGLAHHCDSTQVLCGRGRNQRRVPEFQDRTRVP